MVLIHRLLIGIPLVILLFGSCTSGEESEADSNRRKSPIAIAKINHGETYMKIVYGQPYKNNREIFGSLVPYGEVWRTGANEATELTTTRPVMFGGEKLEAGTYALFTIPERDSWTIILNSELGQWGAFEYNAGKDVMRVDVPVNQTETVSEVFTIQFGEVSGDSSSVIFRWDNTEVQVPVRFLASSGSTT